MSAPDIGYKQDEVEPMDGLATYTKRLKAHRWLLAAALVIFSALVASNQIAPQTAIWSCAALILASLFAPLQSRRERVAASTDFIDLDLLHRQVQSLINAIPDPVLVVGSNGDISAANSEASQTFGNIEIGTAVVLRFRSPEIQTMIRAGLSGQMHGSVEYHEAAPLERWFAVSLQEIKGENGGQQFIMHFRDMDDAKRIDKVRTDFIANASHELRTPLASLTGFIETLAGPARNDAPARDRFLKIMQDQAERMSRLIDDLLTLSRFETARGRSDFEEVDLASVLHHVTDAMRPMAVQSGTSVSITLDDTHSGGFLVRGSRDELIQLFENLIENAIKYGRDNGTVEVNISIDGSDKNFVATVSDDGPGIPEEHLPRLVERFYRVDADTSRGKQGTGLGLSIVRHIIQRHQGRLNIKSAMGEGTTFLVTLPTISLDKTE